MLRSAADSPVAVTAAATSGAAAAASTAAPIAAEDGSEKPASKLDTGGASCGLAGMTSSGCHASGGGDQLSPMGGR